MYFSDGELCIIFICLTYIVIDSIIVWIVQAYQDQLGKEWFKLMPLVPSFSQVYYLCCLSSTWRHSSLRSACAAWCPCSSCTRARRTTIRYGQAENRYAENHKICAPFTFILYLHFKFLDYKIVETCQPVLQSPSWFQPKRLQGRC